MTIVGIGHASRPFKFGLRLAGPPRLCSDAKNKKNMGDRVDPCEILETCRVLFRYVPKVTDSCILKVVESFAQLTTG